MFALVLLPLLVFPVAPPFRIGFGPSFSAPTSTSPSIPQAVDIPKGQTVAKLVCLEDPNQSYALYLPSNYTPARKWPILYAFDPGARGIVPVERFKDAAEKYGWIVVGSNNSRNGPTKPSVDAWNAMSRDTHLRFAIDDGRGYVTGFSGGARLATFLASECHDCIAGVIACGAGFSPAVSPSPMMHFAFFGSFGVNDFNFLETKILEDALAKAGMPYQIELFEGRHEWAPAPVAMEAVAWMELQAMKAGRRQRDDALADTIWQKGVQQARVLEESKKTYEAYLTYVELERSFKGLRDLSELEKKVEQLRASRQVKDAIRDEQQQIRRQLEIERQIREFIAARERKSRESNGAGLSSNDRDSGSDEPFDPGVRLQGTLAALHKSSEGAEDSGDRRVARRVLEGMFVAFFEQGLNLLQTQKRYDEAVRTFKLAIEINSDRPGAFFYLAWACAANGDRRKSLQALKTAVEKGFSDLAAIADNEAFGSIRNDPQYQEIIRALKK